MPINERGETRIMQNPGDPRVPEGVAIAPARRVLILGEGALLMKRGEYDDVHSLYPNGYRPNQEAEIDELEITTVPRPLDKGLTSL